MHTLETIVLYERYGYPYGGETIDQITRGDVAEETRGAWELRCWTLARGSSHYGVTSDELIVLFGATFRTISFCLGGDRISDAVRSSAAPTIGSLSICPAPFHSLITWRSQAERQRRMTPFFRSAISAATNSNLSSIHFNKKSRRW